MSDIAIKVQNLTKIYPLYNSPKDRMKEALSPFRKKYHHDFYALKDVSFEIKKGETVGIIGKNGAGKSTLLKILTGVLTQTSGEVQVNGRVSSLLELGTGFNPELTGLENIYFYGTINGISREEMETRKDEIIDFADIGEFIHQPVKTYSSGMFARLAFAVAINVEPDILIVDEALSVGDLFFVQKCMRFLNDYKKRGTLIFVSHDMGAILQLTSRGVLLNNGQIEMINTPKLISEKYLESLYEVQEKSSYTAKNNIVHKAKDSYINKLEIIPKPKQTIHFHKFRESASSFGQKKAIITDVYFTDANQNRLDFISEPNIITLHIEGKALEDIQSPIIGFIVKNRLGQILFGENTTYFEYSNLTYTENDIISAKFLFKMPILPTGNYTVSPAIADGKLSNHIQCHWAHDALLFEVGTITEVYGLFHIPMDKIQISRK